MKKPKTARANVEPRSRTRGTQKQESVQRTDGEETGPEAEELPAAAAPATKPAPPAAPAAPVRQNHPAAPAADAAGEEDEPNFNVGRPEFRPHGLGPKTEHNEVLNIKLSAALHGKLKRMAQDEGVGIESLVSELLAEGVVLRAWEIVERKNAMRGGNQQQQGGNNRQFNGGNNNNRRPGRHNNQNRRPAGNAWMDDKAQFLEYVRNQEKRRR